MWLSQGLIPSWLVCDRRLMSLPRDILIYEHTFATIER